jgi:hypothetical protein
LVFRRRAKMAHDSSQLTSQSQTFETKSLPLKRKKQDKLAEEEDEVIIFSVLDFLGSGFWEKRIFQNPVLQGFLK